MTDTTLNTAERQQAQTQHGTTLLTHPTLCYITDASYTPHTPKQHGTSMLQRTKNNPKRSMTKGRWLTSYSATSPMLERRHATLTTLI
jgi:hypothetical protein